MVPHSRHTAIRREDIVNTPELKILAESEQAGVYAVSTDGGRQIFITGHSEYDPDTLEKEYLRDKNAGLPIHVPYNYYPDDDDTKEKSYALYNEELSEETTKILLEYRNFFDIVVIFVDNLLDKDSELAFKYFQGFTNIKSQQPFIFFLTKKDKNPDVTSLFKFYTYEYFDQINEIIYFRQNNQTID